MNIILMERIARLGQVGDVVRVKDGYARNYLLPKGKALRATKANMEEFETRRADIEARNLEMQNEAEAVAGRMDGESIVMIRRAGQTGQLYGSVNTRDIAAGLGEAGYKVERSQIQLNQPIKAIGLHDVVIALFADVNATVSVNVARSEDEADRQAAGEDVTMSQDDAVEADDVAIDEDAPDLEEVFEEGAGELADEDDAEEAEASADDTSEEKTD